jgi:CheY-like chemotaxis protein
MADPKRILVVDDDPDLLDFCRLVLERAGYEVLAASSAEQGLTLAKGKKPDLMLLDVMMEESDSGFQLAQRLSTEQPDLPIIVLSAIADASDQIFDAGILGVRDMVNKPVSPEGLLDKVARWVRK